MVGDIGRIYGKVENGNINVGSSGTSERNIALTTTKVSINGVPQNVDDNLQNGDSRGNSTLKYKATYQGIGWDFSNDWAIQETECYPYNPKQTAPPVFSSALTSGMTTISGKSVDGGTVYVNVNGKEYTANVSSNTWSITVPALPSGASVYAYAKASNLDYSYRTSTTVSFAGSGTEEDPYQVFTASDLANINSASYYKLMNDIDLTSYINANSPSKGWIPVGRTSTAMSNFIGNGHKITGLWCNNTDDYSGLFASISNATITDLTIELASGKQMKGGSYTGILVGKQIGGTIKNCKVTGNVSGNNYTGGLAGYVDGVTVEKCSSKGNVSGQNYTAGLIGYTTKTALTSVSANGNVSGTVNVAGITSNITYALQKAVYEGTITSTGSSALVGGIVATTALCVSNATSKGTIKATGANAKAAGIAAQNNGTVELSYSTMNVESTDYVAGVVAYNYGRVNECYSSGNLAGTNIGAGVVGYNDGKSAKINNCFAINHIIDVSSSTGIAMRVLGGYKNGASDPTTDNFAYKEMAVSVNNVAQKVYDDLLNGIAKTDAALKSSSTYSTQGWDFTRTWAIDEGNGYPYLLAELPEGTSVSSISLDKKEAVLEVGKNVTLTATILPENATNKSVTWKSTNTSVATVADGKVTAVAVGTAKIIATTTDGTNLSAECAVTVLNKKEDTGITPSVVTYINASGTQLPDAASTNFYNSGAVGWYANQSTISDNTFVNQLSSYGGTQVVLAKFDLSEYQLSEGEEIETVSLCLDAMCTVSGKNSSIHAVSISNTNIDLTTATWNNTNTANVLGEITDLGTVGNAGNSGAHLSKDVTAVFNADADKVLMFAFYTETGRQQLLSNICLNIETKNSEKRASSISLTPTATSLEVGATETLTATVLPEDATDKSVTWSSDNESVATVVDGVVTAVAAGTANITVKTNDGSNLSATCTITVIGGFGQADTDISKYTDIVYTTNEIVSPDSKFPLEIKMKNAESIVGFQFDLKLPKGMSIAYDTEAEDYDINLSTERTTLKRHSLSYLPQDNGTMRIVCTSGTNQAFSGNDGNIVTVMININKEIEAGDYPVYINNIEMTTSELKSINVDYCKSTLTVKDYTLGDVNNDGKITVTDAACVVAFILGSNTEGLIREAADVNQDGKISVTDAACVVDIILHEGTSPAKEFDFANISDGKLGISSEAVGKGDFAELDVNLNSNYREFTGMQFDLVLPEGMKIAKTMDGTPIVELIGNSKNHNISAVENNDGTVRVVCFSSKNETFEGYGEAIVRLRVAANGKEGMAEVGLRNIELVRPNLTYSNIEDQSTFVNFADVTGITTVDKAMSKNENDVYNLKGMHVNKDYKGIIVNKGKKIIK